MIIERLRKPELSATEQIARNALIHDRLVETYENTHGEIFNSVEQDRLRSASAMATSHIVSGTARPRTLDYGCGTGNLTRHLVHLGCQVMAADVSSKCTKLVHQRYGTTGSVDTLVLNGRDLSNVADASFDLVGAYS